MSDPVPSDYPPPAAPSRLYLICDELSKLDKEYREVKNKIYKLMDELKYEASTTGQEFPIAHGNEVFCESGSIVELGGFSGKYPSARSTEREPF